jgi:hypothetical protein
MKPRLLTAITLLLIAMLAMPVLTPTVQAQGGGDDPPTVSSEFEGYVQYVGEDYAVVDGMVVYANGGFDPTTLSVGMYVVVVAEMQEDGTFIAISLEVDDTQPDAEDPEPGEEITVVGPITFTDDEIMVGDYVIAPAGAFNPSSLEDGDIVIIIGLLLNEDGTVQASIFMLVEDLDDDDECDPEDVGDDDDDDDDCDVTDEDDDDDDDDEDSETCSSLNPVGEVLASEYEVDEGTIGEWRCDGYGYGEIARALALADLADEDAADILARREDGEGWGNILKDYDIHPSELAPGRAISNGKNKNKDDDDDESLDDDGPGKGRGKKNKKNKSNNGRGNPHN